MTTAAPGRIDEPAAPPRRRVAAWALWDWGSAAFNAVVTTFVFSTYLASSLFVDPAIVAAAGDDARNPALVAAKADTSGVISLALTIAGLLIAVLAPVLGQRSDGSGRRRLWLGINTGIVVLAMLGMVFVEPVPSYLWLGAVLLATGNVFFEFASVNYNAMLVQVSTPRTVGRVSGLGWGMGYVGGIVLLALLLGLFLFDFGTPGASGLLGLPSGEAGGALDVRIAILVAAIWCAVFSIPVLVGVPEIPAAAGRTRQGILASYRTLFRRIAELYRESPRVIVFLVASAVFRDGLAAVFTFGAIIAAQVFGFTTTEVLLFGVAANVVAGIGTFAAGWFDDRFGAKPVILVSARLPHPRRIRGARGRRRQGRLLGDGPVPLPVRGTRAVVEPHVPRAHLPRRPRGRDVRPLHDHGPRGLVPRAGPVRHRGGHHGRHALRDHRNRHRAARGAAAHAASARGGCAGGVRRSRRQASTKS